MKVHYYLAHTGTQIDGSLITKIVCNACHRTYYLTTSERMQATCLVDYLIGYTLAMVVKLN